MAIVASRAGAKCGPDAVGLSHLLFAQQDTTFLSQNLVALLHW